MSEKEVNGYFNNVISGDFLDVFCGNLISAGASRTVFRCVNPAFVIKFETTAGHFQNVMEWETWNIVKHTKYKKWFCPLDRISSNGSVLIQDFARDLEDDELPEELPSFFADIKRDNFGMYEGSVVCRDYGNHLLIDKGLNNKMKKAEW